MFLDNRESINYHYGVALIVSRARLYFRCELLLLLLLPGGSNCTRCNDERTNAVLRVKRSDLRFNILNSAFRSRDMHRGYLKWILTTDSVLFPFSLDTPVSAQWKLYFGEVAGGMIKFSRQSRRGDFSASPFPRFYVAAQRDYSPETPRILPFSRLTFIILHFSPFFLSLSRNANAPLVCLLFQIGAQRARRFHRTKLVF